MDTYTYNVYVSICIIRGIHSGIVIIEIILKHGKDA